MAEELIIDSTADRRAIYEQLLPQLQALVEGESDAIANLANLMAALKSTFGWLWVGVYLVKNGELVLGPFQGPLACTRIALGKGVCGKAWELKQSIIVPDVDAFPGHIACSSLSRSEIVVPFYNESGLVAGVIDADSSRLNEFSELDRVYLEQLAALITRFIP